MLALVAALMQLAASECQLRSDNVVLVDNGAISIADVMQTPCGVVEMDGALVIAKVPQQLRSVSLTHRQIANLVRRRVPGLRNIEPDNPDLRVTFETAPEAEVETATVCYRTTRALKQGQLVNAQSLVATSCEANLVTDALVYDPGSKLVRAGRNILQLEYVGRVMRLPARVLEKGQTVVMRLRIGAVTIERHVTVLKAAPGDALVPVQASDGEMFSVPAASLFELGEDEHG